MKGKWGRHNYVHPNSDFVQPAALYNKVMTDVDRDHLISNLVGHMKAAKKELQKRQTAIFYKVDPDYGTRVANGLGLDLAEIKKIAEK